MSLRVKVTVSLEILGRPSGTALASYLIDSHHVLSCPQPFILVSLTLAHGLLLLQLHFTVVNRTRWIPPCSLNLCPHSLPANELATILASTMTTEIYPGKRLSFSAQLCTVRYHGPVAGTTGPWLGVEWDDPTRGKHNGSHQGTKYFTCKAQPLHIEIIINHSDEDQVSTPLPQLPLSSDRHENPTHHAVLLQRSSQSMLLMMIIMRI